MEPGADSIPLPRHWSPAIACNVALQLENRIPAILETLTDFSVANGDITRRSWPDSGTLQSFALRKAQKFAVGISGISSEIRIQNLD
jgi:hypothetical protein